MQRKTDTNIVDSHSSTHDTSDGGDNSRIIVSKRNYCKRHPFALTVSIEAMVAPNIRRTLAHIFTGVSLALQPRPRKCCECQMKNRSTENVYLPTRKGICCSVRRTMRSRCYLAPKMHLSVEKSSDPISHRKVPWPACLRRLA